jgi:tetratricopeptide (TPR) repeat protein
MASYAINHYVSHSPIGFHIVNIIIHALNSFLVFWLVFWLLKSKSTALISSVLFLLHPIHTEAVTSIVGRAELLAFFWSLVTIYFFSKNRKVLAATAFLLGLMSKEVALMVLPVIFYIDVFFLNKNWRKALSNNLFFIYPIVAYSFLRYLALGQYFIGDIKTTVAENFLKFVSFPERIFTALNVLFLYIKKLIWPIHLSADYSFNAIPVVKNIFTSLPSLIGLAMLIGLVFVLVSNKTRKTGFGFASAVFLFPYLMISNLFLPIGTIMGERLMYFPSLGFVILLALILNRFLNKDRFYKIIGYSLLVVIIGFYGVRTFIRNRDWNDSKILFLATVKESPNSIKTRTALAGEYILMNDWEKAKQELEIAKNIYEDNSHLQNLLGVVADHEGNFKLAEEKFKKSVELNPDAINAYINLAELYLKQGKLAEAGRNFKRVIDFSPVTEYVVRYAYIQIALKNPDEAITITSKYFDINSNDPIISALMGTAYFVKGDYKQAIFFLKKAQNLGNTSSEVKEMIKISGQVY